MDKDLIRNIPLFAKLSDADREDLAGLMQRRDYAATQPIFWVGETGDEMFVVSHGKVRLSLPDDEGHDVTVAVIGPGTFFGELSLLDGGPRTATARAETDAGLFSLDRRGFYQFLEKHPAAAVYMISVLGARQREALDKLRHVRNVNEEVEQVVTPIQRVVDRAAAIGASVPFLIANLVFIAGWITLHSLTYSDARERNPSLAPIVFNDTPPTFFWLGLMIGLESILLTIFVLNSQRMSAKRDRIRADLEYQINLKAQTDVTNLHRKIDRIEAALGGAAPAAPPTGHGTPPAARERGE